jgi:hypothetical protein
VVAVTVIATHSAGGYSRSFGELEQSGTAFSAQVTGRDLAPPGEGVARTAVLDSDQHTYILGRLGQGTYTFTAQAPDRTLGTLRIGVLPDGLTAETPQAAVFPF